MVPKPASLGTQCVYFIRHSFKGVFFPLISPLNVLGFFFFFPLKFLATVTLGSIYMKQDNLARGSILSSIHPSFGHPTSIY